MTHRLAGLLAVLLSGMLVGGCATVGSSAETSTIFEAAPWPGGESLEYRVLDSHEEILGFGALSSTADGGLLALRQEYTEAESPDGAEPLSDIVTVWVDPSTFRPQRGERTVVRRDEDGSTSTERWEWRYTQEDGEPVLVSARIDGGGERDERTLRLRDYYYDNESSLWLWRSVELEGYDAHYVSVNPIERTQQTVNLRVPQIEMVTVPAGEFEAYRLLLRTGRAVRTAWIETAEPHRVLRWDNGSTILELLP